MLIRIIILFLLSGINLNLRAQSVAIARESREVLNDFEERTLHLLSKIGGLHQDFFGETQPHVNQHHLSTFHHHLEKDKAHLQKDEAPSVDKHLKPAYFSLFNAMQNHVDLFHYGPEKLLPDSVIAARQKLLEHAQVLVTEAGKLEHEVAAYCIFNRMTKPEDKSKIPGLIRAEFQKLNYLFKIQKLMIPVVQMEISCMEGFVPDSVPQAEKRRQRFDAFVTETLTALKNLPPCCGDHHIKQEAIASLHDFSMEAKKELPHLEKFLEEEEDFILHHQKTKAASAMSAAEKEAYRLAVQKYNEDIRLANELVRNLHIRRDAHLKLYQEAQKDFLKNFLTVSP
jgi:hypothetical protein